MALLLQGSPGEVWLRLCPGLGARVLKNSAAPVVVRSGCGGVGDGVVTNARHCGAAEEGRKRGASDGGGGALRAWSPRAGERVGLAD